MIIQVLKNIFSFSLLLGIASCVSYVHPIGDWATPTDLKLDNQSLEGVGVKLSCITTTVKGFIETDDDTSERAPCPYIAEILEAAGATILQAEESQDASSASTDKKNSQTKSKPKPVLELNVQYKNTKRETDDCKLGYIPFLYTTSIWPCRAEIESRAALVVYNTRAATAREWQMGVRVHQYFGIGALVLKGLDMFKDPEPDVYEAQLKQNFMTFVRNKVYTAKLAYESRGAIP